MGSALQTVGTFLNVRGYPAAAVTGAVKKAIALAILVRRNMKTSRSDQLQLFVERGIAGVHRCRIPKP
jgi:hypothetical protein